MIYLIEYYNITRCEYKIGYSKNPEKRIKHLSTGCPANLKLLYTFETEHNRKVETALHNIFKHKRLNNEWYELSMSEVVNFIATCTKIENNLNFLIKHKI